MQDLIIQASGQQPKALCFAARTDKGVHAIENIATFWFKELEDITGFIDKIETTQVLGLNQIRVFQVDPKFHARGNSLGKKYRYCLNGIDDLTSWRIVPKLDLEAMREALSYVQGTHDFQSFRTSGCTAGNSVKTLHEVSLQETSDGIAIDLYGDAFLRQMIRILVGALVEIGTGLRQPSEMQTILEAKNRRAAGITAPPCGLTLVGVQLKV